MILSYELFEKAKSIAQQRLFGMAWGVRKGSVERNKVTKQVLQLADSDITDKELKDFAKTKHDDIEENVTGHNTPGMGAVILPDGANTGSGDFPFILDFDKKKKKKLKKILSIKDFFKLKYSNKDEIRSTGA